MNCLSKKFKSLGLLRRRNSKAPDLEVVKEISALEFAAAVGMEIIPDEDEYPILSTTSNSVLSSSSTTTASNGRKYSFPALDMAIFTPPGQEQKQDTLYDQGGVKRLKKGRFEMTIQKSSHFYAKPLKRKRTMSGSRFSLVKDCGNHFRRDSGLGEETLDDLPVPLSKSF